MIEELGRGGHGVVFLANDTLLRRQVALKVPRPEFMLADGMGSRFLSEAQATAALDHPNIIKVFDVGLDGTICYIAQELCAGPSLAEWLRRKQEAADARDAATIARELANAVEHAHQLGVLHRDLKPANVLLQPSAHSSAKTEQPCGDEQQTASSAFIPKLADFGIAKLLDGSTERTATQTGTLLGTLAYMSPEQATGSHSTIGPPSDVYGLGAILYEMLTGRSPFTAESAAALLQKVINENAQPPSQLRAEVPTDLGMICLKCLEKSPGDRYRSARDLADDLKRFLDHEPVAARPLGIVRRGATFAPSAISHCHRADELCSSGGAAGPGSTVAIGRWWLAVHRGRRPKGGA